MSYRRVGNAVVEWDDREPLRFTLRGESGPQGGREVQEFIVDLTDLESGFTQTFLNNLAEHLITRCQQLALSSVKTEATQLKSLFARIIALKLFDRPVDEIDELFLLAIACERASLPRYALKYLRTTFTVNPHSPLFAPGLMRNDFPTRENAKGLHAALIDRVLAKALSRAAAAHILNICDTAYANGAMEIDQYAFVHLAFAAFVRPNSYRQIRLSDLVFDSTSSKYSLDIVSSKSQEAIPNKVTFAINEPLGILLTKQRQNVVAKYGHLVANEDIDKLALFPVTPFCGERLGIAKSGGEFSSRYGRAIKKMYFDDEHLTLNANVLRHTVGTWLAESGASAKTIASVLKHQTDFVAKAYVDIAFNGMIDDLSNSMRPAFARHLPNLLDLRSKDDPVPAEKLIRSENLETGQTEDTGECGRRIACEGAPIVCYGCYRFRPFWDADHRINLNIVEKEIEEMSGRGRPFAHILAKARDAKQYILFVMNAADRYRDAMQQKAGREQDC